MAAVAVGGGERVGGFPERVSFPTRRPAFLAVRFSRRQCYLPFVFWEEVKGVRLIVNAAIETAFWTAVEPNLPDGTIVVKTDELFRNKKDARGNPASYPAVFLLFRPMGPVESVARTFGMNVLASSQKIDHTFKIRVTADIEVRLREEDTVNQALILEGVVKGLTNVYPTLGITAFPMERFSLGVGTKQDRRGGETTITVIRVPLIVDCRPMRSQLVA